MTAAVEELLTYRGQPIDRGPGTFGMAEPATALGKDGAALRARLDRDGYLLLPGWVARERVRRARLSMLSRLREAGMLDPSAPLEDGVAAPGVSVAFNPGLAKDNPEVEELLYTGEIMELMGLLFDGEPVRHFDYTWVRCKGGAGGREPTYPHYDITYMGRGTNRLLTVWTPIGDVPLGMGGLMMLEGSHRHEWLRNSYGKFDVDVRCDNRPDGEPERQWEGGFGWYSDDAFKVQDELGGRWLTADYRMGDVLVFCMYMMHGSLDNHTDRIRLSTDSRYQPANEPVDDRWIGEDPPAHGPRAKRHLIC